MSHRDPTAPRPPALVGSVKEYPSLQATVQTERSGGWKREIPGALVIFAATFLAAGIGGLATASSVDDWYLALDKPTWTPPSWLFGPVWTSLYLLMATGAFLIWRREGWTAAKDQLAMYGIQLGLNAMWPLLFFGFKNPGAALVGIAFLLAAIVWTMVLFRRRSTWAALLLAPYLAWTTFAMCLNAAIWWLNR